MSSITSRRKAFKLAHKRGSDYFVGISTKSHVCFDIDFKPLDKHGALDFSKIERVAVWLVNQTLDDVAIFETRRGLMMISKRAYKIAEWKWEWLYEMAIKLWGQIIDVNHAAISLKYGKTTLRVSSQLGNVPRLVRVYPYKLDSTSQRERGRSLQRK